MPLIICACCGRRRNVAKRKKGRLYCENCGARAARVVRRLRVWMETSDYDGIPREEARHRTMGMLKEYAEIKGYKPKWADVKFEVLFKCRPNGESAEPPQTPSGELIKWFWKQASEYSQMMRKAEAAKMKPKEPEKRSSLMTHEDYGELK